MYRFAIIGVTGFGKVHFDDMRTLTEEGKGKPVAATVVNPEEAPEQMAWLLEQGCEIFSDFKEMFRRFQAKIDLCFIPTGIAWHATMTKAALEAGAHVFVEKPAAALLKDVRSMHTASRASLKFVAVGYQAVYQPDVLALKERFAEGKLGTIRRLKCRGLWSRTADYYGRNSWAGRLQANDQWVLDSPFNNALAHYLNLMLFLGGTQVQSSVVPYTVQAELYRANAIESADTACIRVEAAGNQEILFYVTHACAANLGPEMVIETSAATITWAQGKPWTISWHSDKPDETLEPAESPRSHVRDALMARMTDNSAFICDLEIAGTQTLVANAAHDSSEIHDFPAEIVEQRPTDLGLLTVANGIDEAIATAFQQGKLFSELGLGWAVAGQPIDVRDYMGLKAAQPALV